MANSETPEPRVSTGVAGLDTLLGGGLVAGGVYLVMGRPGTGKTTLGNQACFTHVRSGQRAAYVTLLAETHGRMLRNLTSMAFFNADAIGTSISYVGAYMTLRERKLSGLLALLRRVMADTQPSLLVLDGLTAAQALGEADAHLKEFVAELQVLSDMSRCTTLILANMSANHAAHAEHSMVDGLIELTLDRAGHRAAREIEVLKFRGGEHFLGTHAMEISQHGITVRPRTEELFAKHVTTPPQATHGRRVSSGVPNLDALLGGGFLAATATMLLGFSGSGKTMLALHFLDDAAAKQEASLYVGFYEAPERLIECAESAGMPLRQHVESGLVGIQWQPALRYGLDELAEHIIDDVQRRKVRRVVIDGIDGFRQTAAEPERTIRFLTALTNQLRVLDVTVIMTEETQKIFGPEVEVRIPGLSALVDNIILLEYLDVGSELKRLLSVVKQRGSRHDGNVRELVIGATGIELAADPVSASEILQMAFGEGELRTRRPRGT